MTEESVIMGRFNQEQYNKEQNYKAKEMTKENARKEIIKLIADKYVGLTTTGKDKEVRGR